MRILLIEDDQPSRDALGDFLAREGHVVASAVDAADGWASFERDPPDSVFLDLRLPDLSGLELLKRMKAVRATVPVILVTGFGHDETAISAIRLGALDYLKKPVDLGELMVALGRAHEQVVANQQTESFPTVLIAEDDDMARRALAELLINEGWLVEQAANGELAVEVFQSRKIDIALLDIKMPRLSGLDALHRMRELHSDFEAIVLTGYGDERFAISALRAGAMAFIRKPVDVEEVLVLLDKARQKVTLERGHRYRRRELALAHEIIAQLTRDLEISIPVPHDDSGALHRQGRRLLDGLSDTVVLLDKSSKVVLANRAAGLTDVVTDKPLDVTAVHRALGLDDEDRAALTRTIDAVGAGAPGSLEEVATAQGRHILVAGFSVRTRSDHEPYVLVLTHGPDHQTRPVSSG